ncbi:MAG: hypothetical protein ACLUJG_05205 [Lawsonibacter sp.]
MKRKWKVPAGVRCGRGSPGWLFLPATRPGRGRGLPAAGGPAGRTGFDGVAPAGAAGGPGGYNAGASRFRWKNPVGVYPLEADTVTLLGANGESVILVGSQGRFAVDGYPLHDGETLLAEVQNILAS